LSFPFPFSSDSERSVRDGGGSGDSGRGGAAAVRGRHLRCTLRAPNAGRLFPSFHSPPSCALESCGDLGVWGETYLGLKRFSCRSSEHHADRHDWFEDTKGHHKTCQCCDQG
ncbi:unnamed protein product, partial [Urochloa humidicola]